MFIAARRMTLPSSVRSGIWPRADAAPDGAWDVVTTPIYKHCAPYGAGMFRFGRKTTLFGTTLVK
jgi:hypothetical protein